MKQENIKYNKKYYPMSKLTQICLKTLDSENKTTCLEELLDHLKSHLNERQDLWYFEGIQIIFLQELTNTYKYLDKDLTFELENKISTILKILEILVENPEIRTNFIEIQFPFYIYPFLNNILDFQRYETLRYNTLKVIYNLIDDSENTINFLRNTEIIPLTLKIMSSGFEQTQLLASKIFLNILSQKEGLEYSCSKFEKFVAINAVLNSVMMQCLDGNFILLRVLIQCYIKLIEMESVRISFQSKKPQAFTENAILSLIERDEESNKLLKIFNKNLQRNGEI